MYKENGAPKTEQTNSEADKLCTALSSCSQWGDVKYFNLIGIARLLSLGIAVMKILLGLLDAEIKFLFSRSEECTDLPLLCCHHAKQSGTVKKADLSFAFGVNLEIWLPSGECYELRVDWLIRGVEFSHVLRERYSADSDSAKKDWTVLSCSDASNEDVWRAKLLVKWESCSIGLLGLQLGN